MAESDSTTNGCTPVFPTPIDNSATPNPLIHDHPGDTLYAVYCVLDLLEALPNDTQEGMLLDQSQVFGHACVIQCLKSALKFEHERARL